MDTFYSTASHNFTLDENDESTTDHLSLKMNRSRQLLREFGNNMTNTSMNASNVTLNHSLGGQSLIRQKQSLFQQQNTSQSVKSEPISIQQSSIYAQFKLDTNAFIDEDTNLNELVKCYSNICSEHIQFLHDKIQNLKMNRQKQDHLNTALTELDELEKEKNLWNLVRILYLDEQNSAENVNDNDEDEDEGMDVGIDEALLVQRLLRKNPVLRKIKLVIEWLEEISSQSKSVMLVRQKIGEFSEKSQSWEHTLHHLKNQNSFNKKENYIFSNREFVDELDPDAPIRQNKPLHDLDQEDEYKLMEYVYSFIRSGKFDEARDFLFKIGQSWRAATLEGSKLFSDKNFMSEEQMENQIFLNEGNLNRDIWKLVVQKMIKDEHFSPYEKAAYASLGGFVGPILPVCRNYMDFIWAYFKALYNNIIETEIRQKMSKFREFTTIPYDNDEDYFFNSINKSSTQSSVPTITQIFERIRVLINNSGINSVSVSNFIDKNTSSTAGNTGLMPAQVVKNLKNDAQSPFSVVLKHIIMSGVDGFKSGTNDLMEYLRTLISTQQQTGLLLRFSSHLALFYRAASFQLKEESFVEIVDNYAKYLVDNQYKEIIAYYMSHLPSEIHIKRYSEFLQNINDSKERQGLLKLAKERNMNIQAITQSIVDLLSRKSLSKPETPRPMMDETAAMSTTAFIGKQTEMFTLKTGQTLTDEDRTKINAIDWIVYDSVQRFKLLEYANLTMRHFLLDRQNFEATKSIYCKIPADALSVVLTQYNFSATGTTIESNFAQIIENLPVNVTNTIKEYLCFKEYIEAVNVYNEWFEFFHREKPVKPVPKFDLDQAQLNQQQSGLDQSNVFAERIAYDYQLKQYEDLLGRWNSKAKIYCDKARSKFMSLLKFPFGGWMVDTVDPEADENMEDEVDELDGDSMMQPAETRNEGQIRRLQMKALRKMYLPNVSFVLTDMLSKMKFNKDLIKISDLVASENYKLYTLFEAKQMKCLISKVADASICLLDEGGDYLGYN